jgi:hypothetical protein
MIDELSDAIGTLVLAGERYADLRLREAVALWNEMDARARLRAYFRSDRLLNVPDFGPPRRAFSGYDFERLGELLGLQPAPAL